MELDQTDTGLTIPAHVKSALTREQATVARDEAMHRVDVHADSEWKAQALEAVRQTALRHREFISDDVWETGLPEPIEARALGPVFLQAAKRGWIQRTDRVKPSVRSHMSGKPVWRSLLIALEEAAA